MTRTVQQQDHATPAAAWGGRRRLRARARGAAGIVALLLTLAACSYSGSEAGHAVGGNDPEVAGYKVAEDGDEWRTGRGFSLYVGPPASLVPSDVFETNGAQVADTLFTRLVSYDAVGTPELMIARAIESDDQTRWRIDLEAGWTFHDGSPVTASSFVDAWNYTAFGPNRQAGAGAFEKVAGYDDVRCEENDEHECISEPRARELAGLEVVDDLTITVRLAEPFGRFPLLLGSLAFSPLPEAFFADPEGYARKPIGNGPYMMVEERDPDAVDYYVPEIYWSDSIPLVRYEAYGGPRPLADWVEFRIYPDLEDAYDDVVAGTLDVLGDVPPEALASVHDDFGDVFAETASSGFNYLGFPLHDPRFADPRVRKAFSMAIDREAVIDALLVTEAPARSLIAPVVPGARDDACGQACVHDPEAARHLLAEAGGLDGPVVLWFNSGTGNAPWMRLVAEQIEAALGIEVTLESLPFADYVQALEQRRVDGPYRMGWVMDYPSAQNYLEPLYGSGAAFNRSGYSNPQVDELIARGNAAAELDEALAYYHQAEDLLIEEMPHVPLFFRRAGAVHTDRVTDVTLDVFARVRVAEVRPVAPGR